MSNVTVHWVAFPERDDRKHTSVSFELGGDIEVANDHYLLELLFEHTNLYAGWLWQIIEPLLSDKRTHTALSVGDRVQIDGRGYVCANIGWERVA